MMFKIEGKPMDRNNTLIECDVLGRGLLLLVQY